MRPFNEHWLAVTIVVYRTLLGLVGMGSYVPYLALLAILHVTVALLCIPSFGAALSPGSRSA